MRDRKRQTSESYQKQGRLAIFLFALSKVFMSKANGCRAEKYFWQALSILKEQNEGQPLKQIFSCFDI